MKLASILTLTLAFSAFANNQQWEQQRHNQRRSVYFELRGEIQSHRITFDHLNQNLNLISEESKLLAEQAENFRHKYHQIRTQDPTQVKIEYENSSSSSDRFSFEIDEDDATARRSARLQELEDSLNEESRSSRRSESTRLKSDDNAPTRIFTSIDELKTAEDAVEFYIEELLPALEQVITNMDNTMEDIAEYGQRAAVINNYAERGIRTMDAITGTPTVVYLNDQERAEIWGNLEYMSQVFNAQRDIVSENKARVQATIRKHIQSLRATIR